jgi:AcrR family transcriptional regulator
MVLCFRDRAEFMKKPHHHGDLRESLIIAGISLLNEGGVSALTLRKCAAKAGVSHAAPAHHFAGLPGLLQAIAAQGNELLAQVMQYEIDRVENKPLARLHAMCDGYLKFTLANAALTNLMFNVENSCIKPSENGRENGSAFKILVVTCAPFKQANNDPLATQCLIWSMIHGFSQLALLGQVQQYSEQISFADLLVHLDLQLA